MRMRIESVEVDGRHVRFGVCGTGPDAVLLHGWGLGPRAYRGPASSMAAAGCRVFAPSLPGFGGNPELDPEDRTFTGYANWLGRFLDTVGASDLSVVAGHSFGGGVATAFVYEQPWRVSGLLLANAIGSPTWTLLPDEVRTMVERPMWDWGRHLATDLLGSPQRFRILPTLLHDFVSNLAINPLGMFRTGEFVRRADLVHEVGAIAKWGIPVTVAWSDRDMLVPRSAFDELRRAARVDGVVVPGPHAWPIADPVAFGDVALGALVDSGVLTARVGPAG